MAEERAALLSIGTLVRGRYAIKSVLGSGSTGVVYLVRDQKDQALQYTFLVLKEISVLDQQARYHFTIGGAYLRQIQHAALPRIHALFNDDKRRCVYLVMDYVEGERLADLPWDRLTWPELSTWCEPLIAILSYLHHQEQPLFHGDLKPMNIIRTASGKVMLVDPGYVPQPVSGSRPNPYRAPEQFTGVLEERSDVYGCGALLYTILSGGEPVDALTRCGRVSKKRADPLVLASKLSASVPRPLAEVLQRALALDPAERFASVKAFWDALNSRAIELHALQSVAGVPQAGAAAESQITPPPGGGVRAPGGHGRRKYASRGGLLPAIAVVAALLLLLSGAGAWLLGTFQHSQGSSPPGRSVTPIAATETPTSGPGIDVYTVVTGKYTGSYNSYDQGGNLLAKIPFSLIISQQHQNQFSGTFDSPLLSGPMNGLIDRDNGVVWTVIDSAGNAILSFSGGLNGIIDNQITTNDSMGGTLSRCKPHQGLKCVLPGPYSSSVCILNYESSVFIAPQSTPGHTLLS